MKRRELCRQVKPTERYMTAILLALIVGLIYYAFTPYFDPYFNYYLVQGRFGEVPYGALWYLLNPFFEHPQLWSLMTMSIYLAAIAPQIWLMRKGKLDRIVVFLNIFSAILFRAFHAQQDVTVIMFAPLATVNPLFSILLIVQKFAFGWSWDFSDSHWTNMTGQLDNCSALRTNCQGIFVYWLLAFWLFFPIGIYARTRIKKSRQKK